MQSRLKTLERLRSMYNVLTHVHELALGQATVAVLEAETQIAIQREEVKRSSEVSLAALSEGDTPEWHMHESQRLLRERQAASLLAVKEQRKEAVEAAIAVYRENRLQLEQMQSVVREVRRRAALEHARIEQHEADDRFLSRQRWLERSGERRMNRS